MDRIITNKSPKALAAGTFIPKPYHKKANKSLLFELVIKVVFYLILIEEYSKC